MDSLTFFMTRFGLSGKVFHAGQIHGRTDFAAEQGRVHLHFIRDAPIIIDIDGRRSLPVHEPSLVFFSAPTPHRLKAGPEGAEVLCAHIDFSDPGGNPMLVGLPNPLLIPFRQLEGLETTLDLLFAEAFLDRFGRGPALIRLVELTMIQVLRFCIERDVLELGVLAGLAEPRLRRVMEAIHDSAAKQWSVEGLAGLAGMSRASFAALFKTRVGMTPAAYVNLFKMAYARSLLQAGRSVNLTASAVGYASPVAFGRAFRQRFGVAPIQFRGGRNS
jgi:AraC-like DNA-binding protein